MQEHDSDKELFIKAQSGVVSAIHEIAIKNKELVYRTVMSLKPRKSLLDDEISIGFVAILKAIKKFDYNSDYKFSSYAYKIISQHIITSRYRESIVYIPPAHQKNALNIKKKQGEGLSDPEIKESLKLSSQDVEKAQYYTDYKPQFIPDIDFIHQKKTNQIFLSRQTLYKIKRSIGKLKLKEREVLYRLCVLKQKRKLIAKDLKVSIRAVDEIRRTSIKKIKGKIS